MQANQQLCQLNPCSRLNLFILFLCTVERQCLALILNFSTAMWVCQRKLGWAIVHRDCYKMILTTIISRKSIYTDNLVSYMVVEIIKRTKSQNTSF